MAWKANLERPAGSKSAFVLARAQVQTEIALKTSGARMDAHVAEMKEDTLRVRRASRRGEKRRREWDVICSGPDKVVTSCKCNGPIF